MEVLVTGGDTELGRLIAEGFCDAGHRVTLTGARADELEVTAKELDAEAITCDNTDPASLAQARAAFPQQLDTIVNVPAPRRPAGDPRTYSLAELAAAWRDTLDTAVLSAVLTVQALGDQLRSGGSIVSVIPAHPGDGSADAAAKAALADWTAGQAAIFGTRGITVNVVASGADAAPGYDGLTAVPPKASTEIGRLALFLTTPAARHITGQTLHVSHGAQTRFG